MEKGIIIAIKGNLYEYDQYDKRAKMHIVAEVDIDEDGILTATHIPHAFSDEELQDNAVKFTNQQWFGIVKHFIRQDYDLTEEDIETAAEDIVWRCFGVNIPKIHELPEYIAEYMDR